MNETKIFETLFDVLPFGVYVADVDTLNIVYVNEHFKRGTENLSDDSCYKIIYGNDRPCIFCKINELITSDRQPNGKTIIFDNFNELDDKWYRVEERSIYWPNGKLVKYSICVDISELKSVQNQLSESHADLLIKNKKIEEAKEKLNLLYNELKISKERELKAEKLRVLLNLVGNIAHHLNNLNTPIAYITEKLLTSGLYPEIKRELEIIKNSVNKSSQIIQSMIQYCQKAIILKKTFDIVRFIEDYLAEKKQYYEGQYEFIFNKSDNREIYIDFDMQMLRQCFDNIVKNSI
ncbi:MAG: hypothetical protein N3A59_08875, partial [Thermodesulfovibrionales bacterium]|nr:hypothetical protein [Thermodesulfovibrionales bacterium]